MGKPKCKTCNGCMDFIWVDNNRYLNCWFCKTWFTGQLGNLVEVENPYLVICPECNGDGVTSVFDSEYEEYIGLEDCAKCKGLGKVDRRIMDV